jgi:hypothetical protein
MRHENAHLRRPSVGRPISPPSCDIWTTERRLNEKGAPGAPSRKRLGRRSSMPFAPSEELDATNKKQHLIKHSNRIDTDEDVSSSHSSESFDWSLPRPNRLMFDEAEQITEEDDPTTVLLVPQTASTWGGAFEYEDEEEEEEEDLILSPRLFGAGGHFEPVEDRNDDIFRNHEVDEEGRESQSRHFSWSPSLRHDETEDRI